MPVADFPVSPSPARSKAGQEEVVEVVEVGEVGEVETGETGKAVEADGAGTARIFRRRQPLLLLLL